MIIDIPEWVIREAIKALRLQAKDEAGHSQAPDLVCARETNQWGAARIIDDALKSAKMPKVKS